MILDLLRAQIGAGTDVGQLAKSYMDKGALVPNQVISRLVVAELKNLRKHNWLLDGKIVSISQLAIITILLPLSGFPRTVEQAKVLHEEETVDAVISLDVPEEELISR